MVIPDALLDNVAPLFLVMTILAVLVPSLRHRGSWRGIGAAWLVLVAGTLIIAVTRPNDWAVSCGSPGGGSVSFMNPGPCSGSSTLPVSLTAVPDLIGMAVLAAWVWRHSHPLQARIAMVAACVAGAAAIVAVGQIDPNLALLVLVLAGVALNAWPRLQQRQAHG